MSRCVICDIESGVYNSTAPYIKRSTFPKVRWREQHSEYQCDDCYQSISNVKREFKVAEQTGTIQEAISNLFRRAT